jgi:hypothetical protein
VPVAKRDAIMNIYELIHKMQREMNKIHEFHGKYKDVEKKLSQTAFSNEPVRVSKEYRKYPTAGNATGSVPRKTYDHNTPRVQTMQHSSDASDDERVYYGAEDEQPGFNFTTQPKMGKTPTKRDVKLTPTAAAPTDAYPEAPKMCFSEFWGGKCMRGNNCEFHGPDSDKLEQKAVYTRNIVYARKMSE